MPLSLGSCDQARTQRTVGIQERGPREGSITAAWPQANQHRLYPCGEQKPVGWVCSAVVTECWARTGMGCDSLWGECLCTLPEAAALPHAIPCLKDVCLKHQGFGRCSSDVGPFVPSHLPSPSSHNRHLCLRPWVRVRAQL